MMILGSAIYTPSAAFASSPEEACTVSTAEFMVVPTSDIEVVETGPVDPESGVRTYLMRNNRNDQTAECRFNNIDGQVTSVQLINALPSPQTPEQACIVSTAEFMEVPTRDIEIVETGPVDPESGVRTYLMRNNRNDQTAECRFNNIDGQVTSVQLINVLPSPQTPEQECIVSTAEFMLVPTSDIEVIETGPVDPESGVRPYLMRNNRNGQTAECRFNNIDRQVTSVQLIRNR